MRNLKHRTVKYENESVCVDVDLVSVGLVYKIYVEKKHHNLFSILLVSGHATGSEVKNIGCFERSELELALDRHYLLFKTKNEQFEIPISCSGIEKLRVFLS